MRVSSGLMAPVDTDARTAVRSQTGGYECSGWLQFVMRGAGPVAPPINVHRHKQPGC